MAGKKERQRKLARERHARQAARRAQRARTVRIRAIAAGGVCAVAAIGVGAYFLAGTGGGGSPAAAHSATPSASATSSAATVSEPAHHCTYTASGTAAREVSLPSSTPNYTASYQATITTNRGPIVISLLNSKATCTVNSFVHLAQQGYFTDTKCHRLTTASIFVLQCGDPTGTGTGTGGPGYVFASENLKGASYPAGTVAMANTGQPDSNGSQFFLVYKNTPLPASYTPFGTITQGLPILTAIAKAGSDNSNGSGDGHPKENVVIDSVTIRQT